MAQGEAALQLELAVQREQAAVLSAEARSARQDSEQLRAALLATEQRLRESQARDAGRGEVGHRQQHTDGVTPPTHAALLLHASTTMHHVPITSLPSCHEHSTWPGACLWWQCCFQAALRSLCGGRQMRASPSACPLARCLHTHQGGQRAGGAGAP